VTIETLPLVDRLQWLAARRDYCGASEIAALIGLHPWLSPFELWARKTGRLPEAEETPAMRRGRLLEPVAIDIVAEDHPSWTVARNPVPGGKMFIDRRARIACTPDAIAIDPLRGRGVVQVKSVSPRVYRREWRNAEGEIELPLWVAVQASVEAALTESRWAAVAALVVEDVIACHVIDVPLLKGIVERVKAEVRTFWKHVERETQPAPDYGRDLNAIKLLNLETVPSVGPVEIDNEDLVNALAEHVLCAADLKALKARQDKAEALIRSVMGAHETALAGDWFFSNKPVSRKAYTVKETTYRALRIVPRSQTAGIARHLITKEIT
jgi:hypothetical protein